MVSDIAAPTPIETLHLEETVVSDIKQEYLFLKDTRNLSKFILPVDERPTTLHDDRDVPLVDLAGLYSGSEHGRRQIIQAIGKACEDWGFFKLINHPISPQLLETVREYGRNFFHLPLEQKTKAAWKEDLFLGGYGSVGGMLFSTKHWSESLMFRWLEEELRDLSGFISKALPDDYQEFSASVEKYLQGMEKLAVDLLELIGESLNLEKNAVVDKWKAASNSFLSLHWYPPCPQADLMLGLGSHRDQGLITIVSQDDVAGLQVHKDGQWTTVKSHRGALIINIGDLLRALSNNRYTSAIHRVATNSSKERISLVNFFSLKLGDTMISAAPQLVDPEHPLKYRPFTMKEYYAAALNPAIRKDNLLDGFEM